MADPWHEYIENAALLGRLPRDVKELRKELDAETAQHTKEFGRLAKRLREDEARQIDRAADELRLRAQQLVKPIFREVRDATPHSVPVTTDLAQLMSDAERPLAELEPLVFAEAARQERRRTQNRIGCLLLLLVIVVAVLVIFVL